MPRCWSSPTRGRHGPNGPLPVGAGTLHNARVTEGVPSVGRTSFHVATQALFLLLAAAMIYTLISVGIAVATSDKCGSRLDNAKEWSYFPPKWECVAS